MSDLDEARVFTAKDRYATEVTGIVLEEVGVHYAKCSLKLDERHINAIGQVMGGVIYTMADLTFRGQYEFPYGAPHSFECRSDKLFKFTCGRYSLQ